MPYKANEPRCHKIPRVRYKVANWSEYDRALQQRGSLTVWVTPKALATWHPIHTGQRGRPRSAVAWTRDAVAVAPAPFGVRQCGRRSGVQGPAFG